MMNVNFKLIGKRIQEVRKQQEMTQAELAALTDMSDSYISYIETAKKQASLESLVRISNALGITVDELLSGNQLHNPTDYQTDIDLLMEDCSLLERRFIYELISVAKYIIRNNGWELIETGHNSFFAPYVSGLWLFLFLRNPDLLCISSYISHTGRKL